LEKLNVKISLQIRCSLGTSKVLSINIMYLAEPTV